MKLPPLDFEKPIVELEEKLADLKKHSRANDINLDHEVRRMEGKIEALTSQVAQLTERVTLQSDEITRLRTKLGGIV